MDPLFTNVNPGGMQWSTDLIGYDALHAYGSPSYWAQVLFAQHLGDHTVKSFATGVNPRFFWSATVSTNTKVLHLKLVNASDRPQALTLDIAAASGRTATVNTLHASTWFATNSIAHPDAIRPVASTLVVRTSSWSHTVAANTIEVLDIPLQ
jgi:alpha-N-arabinofuranosidase